MTERDGPKLAAMIEAGVGSFLDATAGRAAADSIPWHSGMMLPCATMTSLLVGEHLLHGYDVAAALEAPWTIDEAGARVAILALLPFLPLTVDPLTAGDLEAGYEVEVDGGPHLLFCFGGGGLSLEPVDGRTSDCRLTGGTVAWLLALYGRVEWAELIDQGRVRVSGDPGLGARFKSLLQDI
ncbi:MAG: SCP2 sterol-binding domain-containing protein [Acidimicrobiia bacterium]